MHRIFCLSLFVIAFTPAIARADSEYVSLEGALGNGKAFSLSFEAPPTFTIDPGATSLSIPLQRMTLSIDGQSIQQPVSLEALFGTNLLMSNAGWSTSIAAFNKPFIGENASGTQGQFLPGTYTTYGFIETNGVFNDFHHDNATLKVAAVPEPSVLALVLVGGLSLFGFHLRRGAHRAAVQ